MVIFFPNKMLDPSSVRKLSVCVCVSLNQFVITYEANSNYLLFLWGLVINDSRTGVVPNLFAPNSDFTDQWRQEGLILITNYSAPT